MTETTNNQQLIRVQSAEPTRRHPVRLRRRPLGGIGPLIAIAIAVAVLAIGINPSPKTTEGVQPLQAGPITSFKDAAGTYLRQGSGGPLYYLFFEDGTVHISSNKDLIVDRPMGVYETSFEGTKVFITHTRLRFGCAPPDQGGTYEIHVLENGNLQFVAVDEDTCAARSGRLLGLRDGEVTFEYEPVP